MHNIYRPIQKFLSWYSREDETISKDEGPSKKSVGTGFFVDTDGHIVTNYHVVGPCDGKQKIIPISTLQFALILKEFSKYINSNKKFDSDLLKNIFENLVDLVKKSKVATDWSNNIDNFFNNYKI